MVYKNKKRLMNSRGCVKHDFLITNLLVFANCLLSFRKIQTITLVKLSINLK